MPKFSVQSSAPGLRPFLTAAGGGAHSLALLATALNAPAPVFQVLGPSLTNGMFQLRLSRLLGNGPSVISISSDLQNWLPIYTNPPTIGELDFTDPAPLKSEQRFYRAVEQR